MCLLAGEKYSLWKDFSQRFDIIHDSHSLHLVIVETKIYTCQATSDHTFLRGMDTSLN